MSNRGIGEPIINFYEYEPNESLNILKFPEISDEWLDFIAKCRSSVTHNYDIVEGPMANDTVWNYVNDFLAGRINRKQFWHWQNSSIRLIRLVFIHYLPLIV